MLLPKGAGRGGVQGSTVWAGGGRPEPAVEKYRLRLMCLDSQASAHSLTPHSLPLVGLRVSSQIGIYLFGVAIVSPLV